MFEGLQKTLTEAMRRLTGAGRLTEANIREGVAVIRQALLDADVNYNVVNTFVQRVTDQALGQDVIKSVSPSQQIVKIVYDELVALMGPVDHTLHFAKDRPTVLMLCGLQGSGKTTTCGKLALMLQAKGRKPLLVAADVQRPAAIEQLIVLGNQTNVPVYSEKGAAPLQICLNAIKQARQQNLDTVILDTAGRLHVAEMPMDELRAIDKQCRPDEVFFVCDAMTGQDAVNSAKAFHEALELNGIIMTKLDGDARGGAALSIKEVTQVPIKFMGVGEKLDKLEEFHAERMAQRILGQGDLMTLVEQVSRIQSEQDQEILKAQQEKLAKGDFTLNDFRGMFEQIHKLGIKNMMGMMPGMDMSLLEEIEDDPEKAFRRMQGMIDAMTPEEKKNPDIIELSRRRRIARGCGVEAHEVKKFLEQFQMVRTLMKQMMSMSMWQRMKMMTGLSKMGAFMPGGPQLSKPKIGTGHRKTAKERAEERKKKRKKGKR
ncbi:MAG TPA: signal recognition particle protein [Gemmatales bacterium]|nr:signal recognition particle protein [Gemmatales bacterium]HMP60305.1 signal recognition particle protein [Gemmatales bacterium]